MARIWRGVKLGLAGLAILLLVLLLAWVASNWRDDPPRPVPLELSLGPPLPASPLYTQITTLNTTQRPTLAFPKGSPLLCQPPEDCVAALQDIPKLQAQLAPLAALGEKCQALAAEGLFQEPLPERLSMETPLPPMQGLAFCGAWFNGQAVLAASQGQRVASLQRLAQAAGLGTRVLTGGRWLVSVMVASSVLRQHYAAVAAVAQLQPAWAADLAAQLPALPAPALEPQRWLRVEAQAALGSLELMLKACNQAWAVLGSSQVSDLGELGWSLACHTRIGLLPDATRQGLADGYLRLLQAWSGPLDAAVDAALARRSAGPADAPRSPVWRNTFGVLMLEAMQPQFEPYLLRLADLDLHRTALATALAAQAAAVPVPVPGRDAWLQAQALPARVKARLSWQDQGQVLQARPWTAETPGSSRFHAPMRLPVRTPGAAG